MTTKTSWQKITGFFLNEDGNFLLEMITHCDLPLDHVVLEIGALFGKSTCCLAQGKYKVVSIDPHEGEFQKPDSGNVVMHKGGQTFDRFMENVNRLRLNDRIEVIRAKSEDVSWDGRKIALLFIDGIHDYKHLENDFWRFQSYIPRNGFVAFHDYGVSFYPDVKKFVDKEVPRSKYKVLKRSGNMLTFRKVMP